MASNTFGCLILLTTSISASEHTAIACAIDRFKGHWDFTIKTRLLLKNNAVLKQPLVHIQNIKQC